MLKHLKQTLKLSIAISAVSPLVLPLSAKAQDTGANTASTNPLDTVVITARKREENLQDTPISVSAYSADGLDKRGATNISEIDTFTPNLQFNQAASNSGDRSAASIYIRGVGQSDFVPTTDPGVGVYLDGVYIARSVGSALDIMDIERVEVLRGPQGTLFGRNTIGGAISVTSRKPGDELSGSLSASYGRFQTYTVKGQVDIPIADNLSSSISILRKGSDGYIDRPNLGDTSGEDNRWAGRAALRWEPTDRLEFNLAIDGTRLRETACCGELIEVFEDSLNVGFHNGAIAGGDPASPLFFSDADIPDGEFVDLTTRNFPAELDLWGISLTTDYEISDNINFKSITAFRDFEAINGRDADHSPLQINETPNILENQQFSQELQLQGAAFADQLNWILGLYYFDEDGFNQDNVRFAIIEAISGGFTESKSYAAFAQTTYNITDRLSVTGGLRWTRDEKEFTPRAFLVENFAGVPNPLDNGNPIPPGFPLTPSDTVEQSQEEVTPYANISFEMIDGLLTYASYSEGYKSGGFVQRNFPPRADVPIFQPEFVEVWEVGAKFESADGRLRLNAALFNTDYTDLQIQVFDGIAPVTQNAAAARIRGAELEAKWAPIDGLLVEAGVGYLDAQYTEVDPFATEVSLSSQLIETPEWSSSLGVAYTIETNDWGAFTPRIDWAYQSETFKDARNTDALFQPGFHVLNASLRYESPDDLWSAAIIGRNITDERYLQSGFADAVVQGVAEGTYGRPAEWEIMITRKF